MMKALIENGIDIHVRNKQNESALMWAISSGLVNAAELLIEKGADVDIADDDGQTVLMYGTSNGKYELFTHTTAILEKSSTFLLRQIEVGYTTKIVLISKASRYT